MTHPGETTAPIRSADLSGIIERLENATGPDRELDAQVWLATTPGTTRNWLEVKSTTNRWPPYIIDETRDATGRLIDVPAVTASVDAAIALAERVLPAGTDIDLSTQTGGEFHHCEIEGDFGEAGALNRPSLPIAICIATLRALQSKGEA